MRRRGLLDTTSLALALLAAACTAGGSDPVTMDDEPEGAAGSRPDEPTPARPPPPAPIPSSPVFDDAPSMAAAPQRCHKVDLLYVVDNSASMGDEQYSLARSFAGFSRVLEDTLGNVDQQIMVIDTDARNVGDIAYERQQSEPRDMCDGVLGAGLRRKGSDGQSCGVGDARFLHGDAHSADAFTCLAHVGTMGDATERPMDALLAATGARPGEASDCNTGFLRDDAVLVVTLISDEEDQDSNGDPESWKRTLLRVKGGNEDSIVMLGLLGDLQVAGGLPGGPCDELEGAAAPRLKEFVESFELGSVGSVCADDYSEFFERAVSTIDTACAAFDPQ